ncbi:MULTISPECIES: hydantoinase/oxoprolinase family protein [unclassified Phenylobacterium]|uniref:hydantoinase/oxoprolinase family protein n=1 Tax=unclassified Phenylobacterium TaxID=2640670 RepID=UPI00083ABEF7|nr:MULTISPECIES: hydantoinase/oxoprolinase family protein [unclassified Phenylobacterium]
MEKTIRIGVDIGGTFTDFVLHDEVRGLTRTGKRLTTPEAPSRAIVEGVERLLAETNSRAEQIHSIVHGTTLVTNTVLERTGAKVGLVCTEGFRDVLEMGREIRYDPDDLAQQPAPVIVPRARRWGVRGRIRADGAEHEPLDESALAATVRMLVDEHGVEALAVAFMNSYRNPAHELRARQIISELYPDLLVTLSSEVAPEIREYDRTSTACLNAYVQPLMHGYLDRLGADLARLGFAGDLRIMLSGGGVTTIEEAKAFPIRLIESGPAAGAMAAAHIAQAAGEAKVISFDMGGTTAKMCLVENGAPHVKHDFEAGRVHRFKQGSGLPLKVTVVDMIEIGAGGGSIAAVDALGLMKVGPRSAGSVPGPVAYARGGTEPTVTDADLYLGYLNPDYFLGGEMALALDDVRAAIATRLAGGLGIETNDAARGIQEIVNESMAAATRMHMAEKGKDPRSYTLLAFGGAGPVHAYGLAKLLKVRRIMVPPGAGVISAFGFLVAAPEVDDARGYVGQLHTLDWDHVNQLYAGMEARARDVLLRAGGRPEDIVMRWSADLRYLGQGFEVPVDLPPGPLSANHREAVRAAFLQTYAERFDRVFEDMPIEAINWRLTASLPVTPVSLAHHPTGGTPERGHRTIHFPGFGDVSTAVIDRYALKPGDRVAGPAVFEERESSFAAGPDCVVTVDRDFNLVAEIGADAATAAAPRRALAEAT